MWESVAYQIIYDSLEGIYLEKWLSPSTISVTNDLKFLNKLVSKSDTTVCVECVTCFVEFMNRKGCRVKKEKSMCSEFFE